MRRSHPGAGGLGPRRAESQLSDGTGYRGGPRSGRPPGKPRWGQVSSVAALTGPSISPIPNAFFFFLMIRPPPRSTLILTLFLYTTLFRSVRFFGKPLSLKRRRMGVVLAYAQDI